MFTVSLNNNNNVFIIIIHNEGCFGTFCNLLMEGAFNIMSAIHGTQDHNYVLASLHG